MEPIQESVPEERPSGAPPEMPPAVRTRKILPPKGACWYCDKPLDSVRRFCGKECADAFDEEDLYTR
ncbi:hypothetical protein [Rugamonas sp.]|uniref:hypothetical protein n=1 Tax=Rugamonas sp. TaxID=1926287 RepID=UPI0025EA0ECA|nr:hypothetical protein [Rugamonas sp.]